MSNLKIPRLRDFIWNAYISKMLLSIPKGICFKRVKYRFYDS